MFTLVFVVIVIEGDHVEVWSAHLDEAEARTEAKSARREHPGARISVQPAALI